jgi:hypothetical protein
MPWDKGVHRIFCGFSDARIAGAPEERIVDGDADPIERQGPA